MAATSWADERLINAVEDPDDDIAAVRSQRLRQKSLPVLGVWNCEEALRKPQASKPGSTRNLIESGESRVIERSLAKHKPWQG